MTLNDLLDLIGQKIAELRRERNLTQREFAESVGISYRYMQSIESGRANITLSTLLRISNFFKVQVLDLLPLKIFEKGQ